MKKRVLSMFMALALCLTLLPTAALADELGPVDGTSTVETAGADAEAAAKAEAEAEAEEKADAEAAAAVQAQIDALPAVDELDGMDDEDAMAVYEAFQTACDAYYETLTEEQQAQLKNTEKLAALSDWFSQLELLANSGDIFPDTVDADGNIIRHTGWSRNGPICENSETDADFTDAQFYVVRENDNVTIRGNLTIGGSCGLILCQGAKLTVEGALICGGSYSIYGQSNGGANAGRLVINNSLDNGAAIRTGSTSTPQLNIYSGEVTINAGKSGKLVEGVELYSTNKIHAATLDAKKVLPAEWRGVSSIKGTSLVLEYCGHAEDDPEYVDYVEVDETQHRWQCKACGFEGGVEACFTNTTISGITPNDNGTHTWKCICGREKNGNCSYVSLSTPKATPDGKGHTASMCSECGSPEDKAEAHTYDAYGKCTACTFEPLAKDEAGDLYGRTQDHSDVSLDVNDALAEGHTITLWRPDTIASKTIQGIYIDFDAAGKSATLDMNGYSLETSTGGATIAVENGTLTVKGDATLVQNGTKELASSAVRVTGGSLVFEGDLTAQGGKYGNYDRQPAVKATGGTVEFKGALNLNGGLFLDSCERLASKLTQGSFYSDNNGQGQVYRVQIENDSQHSYDLLADGYAFAEYDAATKAAKVDESGKPVLVKAEASGLMNKDLIIVEHTHSVAEGQSACACGKQFEASVTAEGGVSYYDTIDSAFAAAHEGDTVTLLADITNRGGRGIFVSGGPYTLDLNGHRIEAGIDLMVGDMDGSGVLLRGELTVKDSSTNNAGYVQSLKLWNGDLTVESGSFRWIVESGSDSVGTITITGGTADEVKHTSAGVTFRLSGGTFKYVENIVSGKPSDLLADNRAFFNRDNNFVNGYDDRYQAVSDVVVKEHTHSIVDGVCACGFTCAHDWSDKNGVCKKANCGYHCPHNAGATETGGVWACNTCGQTVTAKVVAQDGSTTTYYADGYVDNNTKSGLYFAIKAAVTGSTVAALGGEYSGGYVTGNKTLTLDVSNGKTIDGMLYVGYSDTGNTLIVIGSAEISYVIVDPGNTLDLTGWTGRIGSLTVQNGGKATLNGGTFATLYINGATAGSLLAEGYAFQNAGTGAYVEYSSTADMENVKVVKCPHSGVTLKGDHTGAECKYCGASFAATLDDAPYDTIDAAITDWLENGGGTLKLYADYTAATEKATWTIVSGKHSIDLNGHRMSVQNDGAFKPTNNMHLTVTDGTKIGQITNILLEGGSFTLESGIVCKLEMTGGAVVALKGGSVDNLDVQNSSANTNLSIQGGSLGKLNIEDWADGMHVSATGGSLGAYTLPSGKILADVLDHQYYAEGTSLDKGVDAAQKPEKFVIKQAPYDFGSTSKTAAVPINGSIPFMVDSPSENVGLYDVKWYRRTNSGAEHMVENKVADVNVGDRLDVFCVITGLDSPGGAMKWQVAVKDYTINVVPADLSQEAVVFKQVADGWGAMGNIGDGKGTFVFMPSGGNVNTPSSQTYCFEVYHDGQKLIEDKDYTIVNNSNQAQYAGDHTLTIQGKGSYTGTATHTWRIEPYKLTRANYNPPDITKGYDGTTKFDFSKAGEWGSFTENVDHRPNDAGTGKNPSLGGQTEPYSIYLKPEDFKVSAATLDSPDAGDRTASFTIELKTRDGQTKPNFAFEDGGSPTIQVTAPAYITKAFLSSSPEAGKLNVANNHPATYTVDLKALLPTLESPKEYGKVTYELGAVSINGGYYDAAKGSAEVKDGKLILPIQAVKTDTTGSIGSVQVKVSTTNYIDFTLTINVNATNKIVPTGEPTLSTKTLTYGQALSAIKLSGKLHDNVNNKDVEGTFTWADGTVKPSAGSYEAAWKFTPADGDTYTEADGTVTITVNQAKPTGEPIYTKITAANKTLKDAALKPNTSWPTGTIQWVDKDGKELPDTTEVKANTAYKWIFTPTGADAANYTTATGELTLYSVSTGGGGGGGSSSGSTVKTDTTTKPDGTKVQTETRADGTKIQTETKKDGSTVKTTTNPNGSSVTESKDAAGSTGTVKTDKNGQTEAKTALSSKAIEDAKKSGEPVKAPVEVKATRDSDTAPTVKVELPKGAGETKVEIPVSNVKPGTVAVLVHADGTEEIVKNSLPTEDGIQLTVNGGATVKIVDNSKDFIDTRNHWAKDAIDFVSARGLVNGMNDSIYAPNASTTRAQLWTILARQNDADLNGGNTWYEKAQLWSKNKGISDGTQPDATITRAQMVTMLWRTMGQPAAASGASFADVPANSYYAQAVAWAVENGITAGVGGGRFDPNSTCTRAQIAAFLARSMK